jgi:hypothetical protein
LPLAILTNHLRDIYESVNLIAEFVKDMNFSQTARSLCLNRWQGRIQRPCPSRITPLFAGRRNFVLNTRGYWLAG